MKHPQKFLLLALIALPAWDAEAQIQDDDSSASLLAFQCAMSSGRPPSNYEEYCRKLAKTVALLAPKQQERVFGYLPRPTAVVSAAQGSASGASSSGGESIENPLVALVGDFNASMGSDDSPGAIIGGSPPTGTSSESESAADEESNWWEGFLGWLGGLIEENSDEIEAYLEDNGSGERK